jgi:two-component system, OmpR family, sensor histidine kinase KdpD
MAVPRPEQRSSTAPATLTGRPGRRGLLKVYLGATPGSGKTFAMLREGRDRREDGEDVVVGLVETHGRPRTAEAIGTLEVVPRISVTYKGAPLSDMDLDGVIARRPHVALVDELAHTNAPGLRNAKRWQDIEEIRDAGIDVISTMNIQHLESVKDLVEQITGVRVQETVPDTVLDVADEVQFIDITPEALRKRMKHGNVYAADRVDTALDNFFRPGNLAALREIGLRFVGERVGTERGGVQAPPEDVIVAVSGRATAEQLIRRAVRLARRRHGMCAIVHVHEHATSPDADDSVYRRLAVELQCVIVEHDGVDIASAVIAAARERSVRHVVIGEPRATGLVGSLRPNIVDRVVEGLPDVDVHVIARHGIAATADSGRPDPDSLLSRLHGDTHTLGSLRIYIGYAPGVGTTTAMLDEARRRASRGTDVVVAALPAKMHKGLDGLPLLGGRRSPAAHGTLDVGALLARNPDVAAVDDLAARTTTGAVVAEVIPQIRAAGITVVGTIQIGDLRSAVAAMAALIDRDPDRPVVDDAAVDAADEVELVDIVPSELEERLRDGLIMTPREAAHALQASFRPTVLATLRELTFRRVAQHTDRRLLTYMTSKGIAAPWEARPRLLVCVPPLPGQENLISSAARLAARRDDVLTAISVRASHRTDEEKQLVGGYAALTHQLGGEFVTVDGRDTAATIATYARGNRITEIVLMRTPGRRQSRTLRRLVRAVIDIDVHILASDH